jgi:hypothetical protein
LANRSNVQLQKYLKENESSSIELPPMNFGTATPLDFPPETFFDFDAATGTSSTRNRLMMAVTSSNPHSCQLQSVGKDHLVPGTSVAIAER